MNILYHGYVVPHLRFGWVGWIVRRKFLEDTSLYADDAVFEYVYDETRVIYVTFGLSKKSVMRRLEKRARKDENNA